MPVRDDEDEFARTAGVPGVNGMLFFCLVALLCTGATALVQYERAEMYRDLIEIGCPSPP
jgi:hypothetical protein